MLLTTLVAATVIACSNGASTPTIHHVSNFTHMQTIDAGSGKTIMAQKTGTYGNLTSILKARINSKYSNSYTLTKVNYNNKRVTTYGCIKIK